jgi:hypothetical protein
MRQDKRKPISYQTNSGVKTLTWEEATQVVKNVFDVVLGVAVEDSQKQRAAIQPPVPSLVQSAVKQLPVNQKRKHIDEKNTAGKLYAHNCDSSEPEYKLWLALGDYWLDLHKNHVVYYRITDGHIFGVKESIDLASWEKTHAPGVLPESDPVLGEALKKEQPDNIRTVKIDDQGRMYVPKGFVGGPLIQTKQIKQVQEIKAIKPKAEKPKGEQPNTNIKEQKQLTCYTCGEHNHVSKMCSWYKTQECVFFDFQKGCSFGEKCRNAHDQKEIRAFCERCQITHQNDQHVFDLEEDKCKACGSVEHQYDQCPEQYCRTCKNNNHWSSNCFKCGQCGEFKHVSANCPYMKKFTGNKFA